MKWVSDIESEGGEATALTLDSVARHRKGPAGRVMAILEARKELVIDRFALLELLDHDFGLLHGLTLRLLDPEPAVSSSFSSSACAFSSSFLALRSLKNWSLAALV